MADLLEGREPAPRQGRLGETWPPAEPGAQWAQVDLQGVRVERVRDFGAVYLPLALWRRLGLHTLLAELIEPGAEQVPWEQTACILTVARFCAQKSELEVAERWYADSALEDLLGVPYSRVNDARLYGGLDVLHAHKDKLCAHLHERYRSWFGVEFASSCSMMSPALTLKAKPRVTRKPGERLLARPAARLQTSQHRSGSNSRWVADWLRSLCR